MTRSKTWNRRWAVTCGAAALMLVWAMPTAVAQEGSTPAALDYEFFTNNVQPIFLAKREGHARCVSCHIEGTPMRLQPLSPGATTWNDEQSHKNFELVRTRVVPGNPGISRLLIHPLANEGGGDLYHSGGKHWTSKDDPEWQTLAAWVQGRTAAQAAATSGASAAGKVRIIQTNSAGDNVHIIDPASNKVVGVIEGIEVGHGAVGDPNGRWIYVSNEAESTLDFVDVRTLRVMVKVPLSGHPNNLGIGKDGRKVYVSVRSEPGGVDIIDTVNRRLHKTVRTNHGIHNTYVTPDGRYAVAGSTPVGRINVIDTATDELAWYLDVDLGIRPMAFDQNPDGSTRYIFAQLSDFNGFMVIDFAARKELRRIKFPDVPAARQVKVGGNVSHGVAVTPDSKILIVNSRLNNKVYKYSLPDFKMLGEVEMTGGIDPNWVTLTPDGKTAYVAMSGSNWTSAIDIASMKEVARIPVGAVPKRNSTARLQ
ncbi:MAG: YncE family protein [Acidobacteria bacterium]|nr:YncE family protein [Acidobacteriota bacterium]